MTLLGQGPVPANDDDPDELRGCKGIATGLGCGILCWLAIIWAIIWLAS